jgi:hypothetical protein
MSRAERRQGARAGGEHRSASKSGRRPARRVLTSQPSYRAAAIRSRSAHNRSLDVVDAFEQDPSHSLSFYARKHGTTLQTIKAHVPTRHMGRRLEPAPPGERHLFRGSIIVLADINGRPQVVKVTPSNDAQWRAIEGHDKAVFAAVTREQDEGLDKYRHRVVVDAETGQRFRFYVDGEGIRDATETGEVELSELHYSGHGRHDLDALLDGEAA